MFDLEIKYSTGNSFGIYEEIDMLDLPTVDIDIAKENLKRIKEHTKFYKKKNSYSVNSFNEIVEYPDFYINSFKNSGRSYNCDGIILLTDKGEHKMFTPFWIGYFERIISAKIITIDSNGLEELF